MTYFNGIDDLIQQYSWLSDVACNPVQMLLLPQVKTLPHGFLAHDAILLGQIRII